MPADVDPAVVDLGIELVNLERLVAEQPDTAAAGEVQFARDLVQQEVNDFLSVRRSAQVAPTVVALRTMASSVVAAGRPAKFNLVKIRASRSIHRASRMLATEPQHFSWLKQPRRFNTAGPLGRRCGVMHGG